MRLYVNLQYVAMHKLLFTGILEKERLEAEFFLSLSHSGEEHLFRKKAECAQKCVKR